MLNYQFQQSFVFYQNKENRSLLYEWSKHSWSNFSKLATCGKGHHYFKFSSVLHNGSQCPNALEMVVYVNEVYFSTLLKFF